MEKVSKFAIINTVFSVVLVMLCLGCESGRGFKIEQPDRINIFNGKNVAVNEDKKKGVLSAIEVINMRVKYYGGLGSVDDIDFSEIKHPIMIDLIYDKPKIMVFNVQYDAIINKSFELVPNLKKHTVNYNKIRFVFSEEIPEGYIVFSLNDVEYDKKLVSLNLINFDNFEVLSKP